jgi:hypothetical protein
MAQICYAGDNLMLRTNVKNPDGPIYREVLKQAFEASWRDRRFWLLAFPTFFLSSAGVYELAWKSVESSTDKTAILSQAGFLGEVGRTFLDTLMASGSFLNIVLGFQAFLIVGIIAFSLLGLACIAQGGLIYAIGARRRELPPTLGDAIKIGAACFWPLFSVNTLVIVIMWMLRFLAALPLVYVLNNFSQLNWILYLVTFAIFVGFQFFVSILQVFALNAIVLQGASVVDAISRAYQMFKKHWLVSIETAAILILVAMVISIGFFGVVSVLLLPLLLLALTAITLQSATMLGFSFTIGTAFMLITMGCTLAFLTQFQYATWTYLYRRLGEGGALPKIQRWFYTIVNDVRTQS